MRLIMLTSVSIAEDMFDEFIDTQTETADAIVQSFPVDGCNSVSMFNTSGVSVRLEIVDDITSDTVYDELISLHRELIDDWWDYWFTPVRNGKDIIFYFPTQTDATATITISYPGGLAKCGLCAPGLAVLIGNTKQGISVEMSDYSFVDTNNFGITYLSVGAWAKRVEASAITPVSSFDAIQRKIVSARATPVVFDLNNYTEALGTSHTSDGKYKTLIIYGFIESTDSAISGCTHYLLPVTIQGMI